MIGFFSSSGFSSYIGSVEKGQEYREIHDQSGDITCMLLNEIILEQIQCSRYTVLMTVIFVSINF